MNLTRTCTTCQKPISLSDKSGRWLPYNLDGTQHFCRDKKVETKPPSLEELDARLKKVEHIVLDPRL